MYFSSYHMHHIDVGVCYACCTYSFCGLCVGLCVMCILGTPVSPAKSAEPINSFLGQTCGPRNRVLDGANWQIRLNHSAQCNADLCQITLATC